jgi:hypothetical protein
MSARAMGDEIGMRPRFASAYALTRSLWISIALHFAWNFTEGGIFGAAVSGGEINSLLVVPLRGPKYLTGGAFGPEASVAAGRCASRPPS